MQSLETIQAQLDELLAVIDRAESEHAQAIGLVASEHRAGAVNLVHYTALRQRDIRNLQIDLLDLGATSLATTEADVRAKIMAARNVVAALSGASGPWDVDINNQALDLGDTILAGNALAVFATTRAGDSTRIMVTLPGEAGEGPDLVASFVAAGMDIARINCAHDDPTAWAQMAAHVRAAGTSAGRRVLVSMDLPGPKLRTGPILEGPAVGRARVTRDDAGQLLAPARIWLTDSQDPTAPPAAAPPAKHPTLQVPVTGGWLADRVPGDTVALTDARGRQRTFLVSEVVHGAALAEGDRNAYIADGAPIRCADAVTVVAGIPRVRQRLSLATGDTLLLTDDLTPPGGREPSALHRGAR